MGGILLLLGAMGMVQGPASSWRDGGAVVLGAWVSSPSLCHPVP